MELIKQNVGVEVDSKKLKVSLSFLFLNQTIKIKGSRQFDNSGPGLSSLFDWLESKRDKNLVMHVTMEATGVYYENAAYYFHEKESFAVHVVLPNTSKAYRESLNLKSKTDEIDAKALGRLGCERVLKIWQPMSVQMLELKNCNRERLRLIKEKTMIINQLHADSASFRPNPNGLKRYKSRISFIENQISETEKELKFLVSKDKELEQRIANVCTAKGLAFKTVVGVVAELNGFALFTNRGQVVSYAGYDVVERSSGNSILGKRRISKKGNSKIRGMLYMAAMSAAQNDEHHKTYYQRIVERTSIKMKGNVAIQRKLLLLIYTLFLKNEPYDPEYRFKLEQKIRNQKVA